MKTIKLQAMRFGSKTFWLDINILRNMKIYGQIVVTVSILNKPQIKLAYWPFGVDTIKLIDYENY